jgi:hypothetical protein
MMCKAEEGVVCTCSAAAADAAVAAVGKVGARKSIKRE